MLKQLTTGTFALIAALACADVAAKHDAAAAESPADPSESAYLTRDYIFVDSREITAYLDEIMRRLLIAKNVPLAIPDVLIRSSDAFDIFTDASGNIVISTELLREVESEDELAAALGHELSHQILKHPQSKDAARAFPMGLETVSLVRSAANRSQGRGRGAYSGNLEDVGTQGLATTQAASLIWSDLLTPAWNRKQERAADQNGFDLMRAAGYDAAAFGALFERLHAAEGRRSERMELLKKAILAKANAKPAKAAPTGLMPSPRAFAQGLRSTLTENAAEGIVTGLASFNRDYDPPEERQRLLAVYAQEHRERKLSTAHPVRRFDSVLRRGTAGRLLESDAAAIRTLNALAANDLAAADKAVQPLMPRPPLRGVTTPHLHFAVGAWHHYHGRPAAGEEHARAWLAGRRPPAQAYVWVAYYQAMRKEFTPAMRTLEQGRRRIGNAAPFLPHLVSLARAAGQNDRAESYAVECLTEDQKNTGALIANVVRGQQMPSGLYADCVRRLGHEPAPQKQQVAALALLKKPLEVGRSLTEKLRNKFHRNRQ